MLKLTYSGLSKLEAGFLEEGSFEQQQQVVEKYIGYSLPAGLSYKFITRKNIFCLDVIVDNEKEYYSLNSEYKNVDSVNLVYYVTCNKVYKNDKKNGKFKIYTNKHIDWKDLLIDYLYSESTTYSSVLLKTDDRHDDLNHKILSGGRFGLLVDLTENDFIVDFIFNKS